MNKHLKIIISLMLIASVVSISGCITADADDDGYADKVDAFPYDDRYHKDSDGDGYADKIDAFPEDSRYHQDSDNDGYADKIDDFPKDKRYHKDSDGDGYADEVDEFPKDSRYHSEDEIDSDGDGYADKIDAFPRDKRYHLDSDGDGYADKIDAFPKDSKYHLDSDSDGYADKVDAFPNDSRYHSDYDGDGYADEVDEYPYDSSNHVKCSTCGGDGIIIESTTKSVRCTYEGKVNDKGIVNPDYYLHIFVTNIDSHEGTFTVTGTAMDNGVTMWQDSKSAFIGSGETHEFILRYDANEYMDDFSYKVKSPTYIQKTEKSCTKCGGDGKL